MEKEREREREREREGAEGPNGQKVVWTAPHSVFAWSMTLIAFSIV